MTSPDVTYGSTERSTETIQNRDLAEAVTDRRILTLHHLGDEVFLHLANVPTETPKKLVPVLVKAHGQRRQTQTNDPALRALVDMGKSIGFQRLPCGLLEHGRRLVPAELQIPQAHFGHESLGAERGQWQRWIASRDDHEVERPRRVFQQSSEQLIHVGPAQEVIVIQD